MDTEEIIKIVESTAFYQVPDSPNIVYVNLERLKEVLNGHSLYGVYGVILPNPPKKKKA